MPRTFSLVEFLMGFLLGFWWVPGLGGGRRGTPTALGLVVMVISPAELNGRSAQEGRSWLPRPQHQCTRAWVLLYLYPRGLDSNTNIPVWILSPLWVDFKSSVGGSVILAIVIPAALFSGWIVSWWFSGVCVSLARACR